MPLVTIYIKCTVVDLNGDEYEMVYSRDCTEYALLEEIHRLLQLPGKWTDYVFRRHPEGKSGEVLVIDTAR